LAARGIDIPFLENVVHFDFPTKMKLFIHRAGRTARAGRTGVSYGILTQEELAYMHDLSIFVGRDHKDKCNKVEQDDSQIMCYGRLPQHLLDEYMFYLAKLSDMHDSLLEPLLKSRTNAIAKYNKTRDPASAASVALMRSLPSVAIHPCLTSLIDDKE
jgi:ATP-dependent RNA helicase DDX54/DBP10